MKADRKTKFITYSMIPALMITGVPWKQIKEKMSEAGEKSTMSWSEFLNLIGVLPHIYILTFLAMIFHKKEE